jgi:hypothetical protein
MEGHVTPHSSPAAASFATCPRVRNTPRTVLEANQVRRFHRRRRYPSSHPLPRFGFLAPSGDHRWGTSTRIRLPASRTADLTDLCEDAAAVALCLPARRLRGLGQREVIDSAIDLCWADLLHSIFKVQGTIRDFANFCTYDWICCPNKRSFDLH